LLIIRVLVRAHAAAHAIDHSNCQTSNYRPAPPAVRDAAATSNRHRYEGGRGSGRFILLGCPAHEPRRLLRSWRQPDI